MEYQKTINLLYPTPNQTTEFRARNWIEINDESQTAYNNNNNLNNSNNIKFKSSKNKFM